MSTIKVTPQELRDAATFLAGKRDEVLSAVNAIKAKIDATTANWEGASQSAFVASFEDMLPTLRDSFPQCIEGIEGQLKAAADVIEEADINLASKLG